MFEKLLRRLLEETPVGGWLPDRMYIPLQFRSRMGRWPDLKHPATFNEKIQWLKLHDRNPLYPTLVDKAAVKEWAAARIGREHIIPTIAVWDSTEDIDLSVLPERFVLKCTHDSGSAVLCTDRAAFDLEAARRRLGERLALDYGCRFREWPYSAVPRRIIAEEFMGGDPLSPSGFGMTDYKFFCFGGKPELLFVATDRNTPGKETCFDFFDASYNHIPVRNGHPNAASLPEKPEGFETMKALAAKLSEGLPFVRVDFYQLSGRVLFGEMTLYHWSGLRPFEPESYDRVFGDMIPLTY